MGRLQCACCTVQDCPHAPLETLQDYYKPSEENSKPV